MLFNSFEYFLFLICVVPLYYALRLPSHRRWLLLAASCFFYMFFIPQFILILFVVIGIDYYTGIAISRQTTQVKKRFFLIISICSNLSILFFFKYFNFFITQVETLTGSELFKLNIILPIGLSFHTFQSLSYVIEVYRGKTPPEKRIDVFALYVLFFPQLVAGPIERPQNILYQLKEKKSFDLSNLVRGVQLISMGLIKKCILADRLSIYVDGVFNDLSSASSISVLMAVIFFSLQIYMDFSGYSDIALGSARCLGINLMENFNRPYMAHSVKEFWTRWHISLSTWFRDYVFIPLGGSRVSKLKYFRNIMIVFALSGLWHGASWNFVIWGLMHGCLVYISAMLKWSFEAGHIKLKFLDILFNFATVTLLWVLFRAPDFSSAKTVFLKLFSTSYSGLSFSRPDFGLFSLGIVIMGFVYVNYLARWFNKNKNPIEAKQTLYHLAFSFAVIVIFGVFSKQSFIYFQF